MKRTVSLIALVFALLIVMPNSAFGQSSARIKITGVEIAFTDRVSPDGHCAGKFGFCLIIHFSARTAQPDGNKIKAKIGVLDDDQQLVRIDFKSPLLDDDGSLRSRPIRVFEPGLAIDDTAANKLGYERIILLPGDYPIDYSTERDGSVLVKARLVPR